LKAGDVEIRIANQIRVTVGRLKKKRQRTRKKKRRNLSGEQDNTNSRALLQVSWRIKLIAKYRVDKKAHEYPHVAKSEKDYIKETKKEKKTDRINEQIKA